MRAVKAVLANIDMTGELQERLVRHPGVQRSGRLPQDPAHFDALWPGHGHSRARRVQARLQMSAPARKVHFGHYLAYGSNDFLGAGAMSIIGTWMLFFYTTFCGLTAAEAGIDLRRRAAARRVLLAPSSATSPTISTARWLGKRFGRRRFFILLAIPLLPSFALMWVRGAELLVLPDHVRVSSSSCTRWRSSRTKRWRRRCRRTTRPRRSSPARASSAARSRNIAGIAAGRHHRELGGKESADTFLYLGIIFSVFFVFVALDGVPVHLGAAARGNRQHRRRSRCARRSAI